MAGADRGPGAAKIFCLTMQRSGVTSVGDFLEGFGLARPGWAVSRANEWGRLCCDGRYDEIFASADFRAADVLDDGPWWYPRFYEVLHERFPDARFILVERDADAWFRSMCLHSAGRNPGHTGRHCQVYGREDDLAWMVTHLGVDPDLPRQIDITCSATHYKAAYARHYADCQAFFADKPGSLLHARLEDPGLFDGIRRFLGLGPANVPSVHANRSGARARARLERYLRRMGSTGGP